MSTAAATKLTELRENQRYDFQCEVSAQSDHQFFTGFTENISAGGLFISTYETLPLGTRFRVAFNVQGMEYTFAATAEVRWLREYSEMTPHMTPGMGVNFIDLTPRDEQILDAILQRIDTMFYDDEEI